MTCLQNFYATAINTSTYSLDGGLHLKLYQGRSARTLSEP